MDYFFSLNLLWRTDRHGAAIIAKSYVGKNRMSLFLD